MEHEPYQPTRPEDFFLERNPDLVAIAKTDQLLYDRLDGVRIARQIAAQNPDNEAMQRLPSEMETAVRDYVTTAGYQWQELEDPNRPPA